MWFLRSVKGREAKDKPPENQSDDLDESKVETLQYDRLSLYVPYDSVEASFYHHVGHSKKLESERGQPYVSPTYPLRWHHHETDR